MWTPLWCVYGNCAYNIIDLCVTSLSIASSGMLSISLPCVYCACLTTLTRVGASHFSAVSGSTKRGTHVRQPMGRELLLVGATGQIYIYNDIIVTLCACVYTNKPTWCRVNVRKAVCACGYVFASKKSTARESKRVAMNIGRSLESADETAARKSIVNVP